MSKALGAPMTPEEVEVEMAIREWIKAGVMGRWRCEICDDWVPFILAEMDEPQSRKLHARNHQ